MKFQIIKTLTFLVSVPYIAWEARKDDEIEYYRNLTEVREAREEMEKWVYEVLQKELRNEPANSDKREMIINTHRFLKNFFNQTLEGMVDSLHFAHWLRTKINSSEKQVAQLDALVEKIERTIQILENQENINSEINVKEDGYEVISQQQIVYEKEKQEWQKLLVELESKLDFLTAQNWINYDLVEEEISHGEYEYTLITQIQGLKAELELEREEANKALQMAQEWHEKQKADIRNEMNEVVQKKDQQIQQLQTKISELERQLTKLQLVENQSQSEVEQQSYIIQQKPFGFSSSSSK